MPKPLISIAPVARAVPFDKNEGSFNATEVQGALRELRTQVVLEPEYTVASNGGTLTLTVANKTLQVITGTATGYTVRLPDATTLFNGFKVEIINQNSSPITIQDGSGATLFTLGQTSIGNITLQSNAAIAGAWVYSQTFISTSTGIVQYNLSSAVAFATSSLTDVVITGFTITPTAGTYAIWYNATMVQSNSTAQNWWSIYAGGAQVVASERNQRSPAANQTMPQSAMAIFQFNGSQACDIRVRTNTGSITINGRTLILVRLGP